MCQPTPRGSLECSHAHHRQGKRTLRPQWVCAGNHGDGEEPRDRQGLWEAYSQLWDVMRLPAVRRLSLMLLLFRIGMLPAEQAGPLKLLEKGVSKEALAGLVGASHLCLTPPLPPHTHTHTRTTHAHTHTHGVPLSLLSRFILELVRGSDSRTLRMQPE